ncbi:MAG: hypothetical protein COA47_07385 [Robiginitomaculum sp.]|nr:MAG: hypothetical protein COA47_07385 [Robiginitomaculum sp.]
MELVKRCWIYLTKVDPMLYFRPTRGMSLALIPALLILLWLGFWQVQRLHWKNDLIAKMDAGSAQAARPFTELQNQKGQLPDDLAWQQVQVRGTFVADVPMRRLYTIYEGVVGYRYLTLLAIDGAPVLFVDRGFAPIGQAPTPIPTGAVIAKGFLHPAGVTGWMSPEPDQEKNLWYWRDIKKMLPDHLAAPRFISNFVIDLAATDEVSVWPRPVGAPQRPPNNHLDYALTWFGLAISLLGVYLVWHWKNGFLRFSSTRS